jgi:hypothetical protein
MGVRQTLNNNQVLIGTAVFLALVAAGVSIAYTLLGNRAVGPSDKAFYTVDDGATWFVDSRTRIPPFTHDGKEAVRVYIYSTDGGKTTFPVYLLRYNKDAKAKLDAEIQKAPPGAWPTADSLANDSSFEIAGAEVKKARSPSDPWVKKSDGMRVAQIMGSALIYNGSVPSVVEP